MKPEPNDLILQAAVNKTGYRHKDLGYSVEYGTDQPYPTRIGYN